MSLFIICSLSLGPVFGNMDKFVGLGVFVDTYPNEEKQHEVMASVRARACLLTIALPLGAEYRRECERQ